MAGVEEGEKSCKETNKKQQHELTVVMTLALSDFILVSIRFYSSLLQN